MITKSRLASSSAFAAALGSALLALAPAAVRADDDTYFSPTDDRVRITLGVTHVSNQTNLRANSSLGVPGTLINAENEFGLDHSDFEPKFQATVRVATRHRLSFDYLTLDRTGNTTLTGGPIVFKDVTLLTGDPVQSKLSLRSLGMTYEYSFWHSQRLEVAATFGVHVTDISAQARVQSATRHLFQAEDQAGPIPTIGLDGTWVASKRFYFDARGQYLKVNFQGNNGTFGIYDLDALYRLRPNVSFGVGYNEVKANLTTTKLALFDLSTKGPTLFFRAAF